MGQVDSKVSHRWEPRNMSISTPASSLRDNDVACPPLFLSEEVGPVSDSLLRSTQYLTCCHSSCKHQVSGQVIRCRKSHPHKGWQLDHGSLCQVPGTISHRREALTAACHSILPVSQCVMITRVSTAIHSPITGVIWKI